MTPARRGALLAAALIVAVGACARRSAPISSSARASAHGRRTCAGATSRSATSSPTPAWLGVTRAAVPGGGRTRRSATWHGVETAQTSSEFVGFTQAQPFADDGASVIGFSEPSRSGSRTLAATTFTVDVTDGRILESDIFFNSTFPWSVPTAATAERFDVESIAVHEIGHLLGLWHSALGETELISGGPPRAGRRGGDVPDRLQPRQHRRPDAQGRRHRRDLGHLRHGRVHARLRQHQPAGSPRTAAASWARTSSRSAPGPASSSAGSR